MSNHIGTIIIHEQLKTFFIKLKFTEECLCL